MKFFLLSDNIDTQIGMRLAGVDGKVIHEKQEFCEAFDEAVLDNDTAVLLITEKLIALAPSYIEEYKINAKTPLIVELPDRHGSMRSDDYIMDYVRDAIGVKM